VVVTAGFRSLGLECGRDQEGGGCDKLCVLHPDSPKIPINTKLSRRGRLSIAVKFSPNRSQRLAESLARRAHFWPFPDA
jgi:hypothetical protein